MTAYFLKCKSEVTESLKQVTKGNKKPKLKCARGNEKIAYLLISTRLHENQYIIIASVISLKVSSRN